VGDGAKATTAAGAERASSAGAQPCAACGSTRLVPHLQVAGEAGPDGLIPTTDRFGTALANIVRCLACGHMQLDRFPSDAELGAAYGDAASDDYVEEAAGQRVTARRILERIERHAPRGALLDAGCWVGYLLAEARDRGWQTVGVEPSEFASSFARDQLGLDVRTGELFSVELPKASYQAVVLGDVIEHLPDPGAAVGRIADLLAPDGVMCLMLPDAGSRVARLLGARWWSVIPTHVQYFTRKSMRTLLARHGLEVLELRTAPKAFTVRYYLDRLGGYSRAAASALVRTASAVGVTDRMWAPDLRDRMYVIAARRRD
jgi:SAM-dependent methyltransferase